MAVEGMRDTDKVIWILCLRNDFPQRKQCGKDGKRVRERIEKQQKKTDKRRGKAKVFSRRFVDNNGSFLYNVKVCK